MKPTQVDPFGSNLMLSPKRSQIYLHNKCGHRLLGPILSKVWMFGWGEHHYDSPPSTIRLMSSALINSWGGLMVYNVNFQSFCLMV